MDMINLTDDSIFQESPKVHPYPLRFQPQRIAILPDSSKAYVTNKGDDSVSVIDLSTFTVAASTIPVGDEPVGIDVTPDGSRVYVVNSADASVSVITTQAMGGFGTDTVIHTEGGIGTRPYDIAIAPDTLPAKPAITSKSPATPWTVGTSVTLNGSNFDPVASNNVVMLNAPAIPIAVPATVTSATSGQVVFTVPEYAPYSSAFSGYITVSVGQHVSDYNLIGGNITDSAPTIKYIDPPAGVPSQIITIYGTNLSDNNDYNKVYFSRGGWTSSPQSATEVTTFGDQIKVEVPNTLPECGTYSVYVQRQDVFPYVNSNEIEFTYGAILGPKEFTPNIGDAVFYPVWSHAGDKVAFISRSANGDGLCGSTHTCDDWNVYVLSNFSLASDYVNDSSWGSTTLVTNDDMDVTHHTSLAWSADDQYIGFQGCSLYGTDSNNASDTYAHCDTYTGSTFDEDPELFWVSTTGAMQDWSQLDLIDSGFQSTLNDTNSRYSYPNWSGSVCATGTEDNVDILLATKGSARSDIYAFTTGKSATTGLYVEGVSATNPMQITDFGSLKYSMYPQWSPDCSKIMFVYTQLDWDMGNQLSVYSLDVAIDTLRIDAASYPLTILSDSRLTKVYECTSATCPYGPAWFSTWWNTSEHGMMALDLSNSSLIRQLQKDDPVSEYFTGTDFDLWKLSAVAGPNNKDRIQAAEYHEYQMVNCADHNDTSPADFGSPYYFKCGGCPHSSSSPFSFAYTSLGPKTDGALRFLYYWQPECPFIE